MSAKSEPFSGYSTFYKALMINVLMWLRHDFKWPIFKVVHLYSTVFPNWENLRQMIMPAKGQHISRMENALPKLEHGLKTCPKPCCKNPQTVLSTEHVSPLYIGGNVLQCGSWPHPKMPRLTSTGWREARDPSFS